MWVIYVYFVLLYDPHIWVQWGMQSYTGSHIHTEILIYVRWFTHIWVTHMIILCTYMIVRIWLHASLDTYMILPNRHIRTLFGARIWGSYMTKHNHHMLVFIWSFLHVYDYIWVARIWLIYGIWYSYMSMQTYDNHIWVRFPLWCLRSRNIVGAHEFVTVVRAN